MALPQCHLWHLPRSGHNTTRHFLTAAYFLASFLETRFFPCCSAITRSLWLLYDRQVPRAICCDWTSFFSCWLLRPFCCWRASSWSSSCSSLEVLCWSRESIENISERSESSLERLQGLFFFPGISGCALCRTKQTSVYSDRMHRWFTAFEEVSYRGYPRSLEYRTIVNTPLAIISNNLGQAPASLLQMSPVDLMLMWYRISRSVEIRWF